MTALLLTILLFAIPGAAVAAVLRLPVPATIAGRISCWYLAGIATMGIALYALGVLRVPITGWTVGLLMLVALVAIARWWAGLRPRATIRHPRVATILLWIPLVSILLIASLLPLRGYDGHVTWLPKAMAIAHERMIDGAFFHGEAGLNLHNEYPLLMPLNAAAVFIATRSTEPEAVRWMYPLVAIAALLAVRDLLAIAQPRSGAWMIAAVAWLPILLQIDGGALSAYNDLTVFALTGLAVVTLNTTSRETGTLRAAGLFLSALVLSKNEGVVLAMVVIVSAVLTRRLRGMGDTARVLAPVIGAAALLALWRARVPSAYDERYDVLIRSLPEAVSRLPHAARALAKHAIHWPTWGGFWVLALVLGIIALFVDGRRNALLPLAVIAGTLATYTVIFAVTSWNIDELAQVSASRLLLHLVIPACMVIAVGAEGLLNHETAKPDAQRAQA